LKKAADYRKHAEQCRRLARRMAEPAQKEQLLVMAETWEQLARDRESLTRRYPELRLSEHEESAGRPH
jgi:hypothetical protein